jgi:hypothetical protein
MSHLFRSMNLWRHLRGFSNSGYRHLSTNVAAVTLGLSVLTTFGLAPHSKSTHCQQATAHQNQRDRFRHCCAWCEKIKSKRLSETWRIHHDIRVRTPCGKRICTVTVIRSYGHIHATLFARLGAGAVESSARLDGPGCPSQSRRDSRYRWRHDWQATGFESRFRQCDHQRFDQDCNSDLEFGKDLLIWIGFRHGYLPYQLENRQHILGGTRPGIQKLVDNPCPPVAIFD